MEISVELITCMHQKEFELTSEYPIVATYGTKCSLWSLGLDKGMISPKLFNMAKNYYGRLWNKLNS